MDKGFFRQLNNLLKRINLFVPLAVAVVFGIICIFALRQNNLQALKLRDKVYQADQQNGDVEGALRDLRKYIYSHMNTDLSSPNSKEAPIQLKYRYERLLKEQQDKAGVQSSKVVSEAQVVCEKQFPQSFSGSGRIPCVTQYISSHGVKQDPIPDALYKFDFVSPKWSPDLAGWTLVITTISLALFAIRMLLDRWVKAELRALS